MSKWLSKFLEEKHQNEPDKTDKCTYPLGLLDLSDCYREDFDKKVKNMPLNGSDKPDKSDLSGLSGYSEGINFDFHSQIGGLTIPSKEIFDKKAKNTPQNFTDKSDKTHLSGLSGSFGGVFSKKDTNPSENRTDNTEKPNGIKPLSDLSGLIPDPFIKDSILDAFEERIAIAEYDGQQDPVRARRIAYQDAFIAVLNALPYKGTDDGDWLEERIRAAREWLLTEDMRQLA